MTTWRCFPNSLPILAATFDDLPSAIAYAENQKRHVRSVQMHWRFVSTDGRHTFQSIDGALAFSRLQTRTATTEKKHEQV